MRKLIEVSFGSAINATQYGGYDYMRLPQWSEDVKIRVQRPDEHSKMTAPYFYVESRFGRTPWKETNIEMFSTKWECYKDEVVE